MLYRELGHVVAHRRKTGGIDERKIALNFHKSDVVWGVVGEALAALRWDLKRNKQNPPTQHNTTQRLVERKCYLHFIAFHEHFFRKHFHYIELLHSLRTLKGKHSESEFYLILKCF